MESTFLQQAPFRALLKLGFLANLGGWIPISLVFSTAALVGFNTVRWNGAPVHGVAGFMAGCLIGALFILAGTLLFALGAKFAVLVGSLFSSEEDSGSAD